MEPPSFGVLVRGPSHGPWKAPAFSSTGPRFWVSGKSCSGTVGFKGVSWTRWLHGSATGWVMEESRALKKQLGRCPTQKPDLSLTMATPGHFMAWVTLGTVPHTQDFLRLPHRSQP